MTAKYKAIDIANIYIRLANDIQNDFMDNLKINKLLYYAQGWSLAKFGIPLFDEKIEAWDYGPVVPEVYHAFKCCGKDPINEPQDIFDESRLSTDELELLVDVYNAYGKYTGWALKEMTHEKGSPWHQVYEKGKNNIICNDMIKAYFEKQSLETFDVDSINLPEITQIPVGWDSQEDNIYG